MNKPFFNTLLQIFKGFVRTIFYSHSTFLVSFLQSSIVHSPTPKSRATDLSDYPNKSLAMPPLCSLLFILVSFRVILHRHIHSLAFTSNSFLRNKCVLKLEFAAVAIEWYTFTLRTLAVSIITDRSVS